MSLIPAFLIFGPPGSGKGTVGAKLAATTSLKHLSTGDIFRGLPASSESGKLFYQFSNSGKLVPDEVTVQIFQRYVNGLGGENKIMDMAREALAAGDYRWAAEILKHVVFFNPQNQEARDLQADAFEQMGYQAECATWRGFYLSGAKELRDGITKITTANPSSPDVIAAMPVEMILDYLAVRLNSEKAAGKDITVNFNIDV